MKLAQLHQDNASRLLIQTLQRIEGAYAPATIRAFKADFNTFIIYCQEYQTNPLPTHPSVISNYIDSLSDGKFTSAYIRRILVSISTIHKLNRLEDPTKDCDVQLAMRRMHRKLGRSSKQVLGINRDLLNEILKSTDNSLHGTRDRALLLVAYDTLCRRSEIVNLLVDDIKFRLSEGRMDRLMSVQLRKSKTDQDCQGKWLHLSLSATAAVEDWLAKSEVHSGPIFRGITRANQITENLGAGQIARIYKKLAKKANLDCATIKNISGHSMRVGAAQDLVKEGASMPVIMNRGRWSKTDTVMRYVEQM